MPVRYDICNVNDIAEPCRYCNSSGYQFIGGLGYRACQYCTTGYKIRNCPDCRGTGCQSCTGTMHTFYSEIAPTQPCPTPDPSTRPYAGEATRQPVQMVASRTLPRR